MGADVDLGEVTDDQRTTMLALLSYPNPEGIHTTEARWRNFARVELSLRDERIRQLEKQCASLAAEVDRQRPVVEAAVAYLKYEGNDRKELITLRARINSAAFQYQASNPK